MGKLWNYESFGEAPALISDSGVTLTYHNLASLGDDLEHAAMESGCLHDGHIPLTMFICSNTLGALAGYAALSDRRYPILPVSASVPDRMSRKLMNMYRPGMLFIPKELRKNYPALHEICTVRDYVLLKTNYPEHFPVHPELGLLITTSGSTGSAKLVRQSWDNLRFNAAAIADSLQISASDRSITSLTLQYTYGLSVLHANLLRGGSMVVTKSGVMDGEFWDLFEEEKVTCFHGVPTTYEMLHHIGMFDDDFPSLKTLSQAGGKLSVPLQEYYARYAEEYGKRFVIMYGQSEATAEITWLPPEDAIRKPGSVGIVIPGGSISLIDDEGGPVTGANSRGELVYQGPNVAMGYACCGDDLQLGAEWNGVLHTGDIAEFDEEGYLAITGRKKRYIKIAGHRISLDEIDEFIITELGIHSVSVGKDDDLVIFVTDENEKELITASFLENFAFIHNELRILTIPEFPMNEGGKVLYSELEATIPDASGQFR